MAVKIGRVGVVFYKNWTKGVIYNYLDYVRDEKGTFLCLAEHVASDENRPVGDSELWATIVDNADIDKINAHLNDATNKLDIKSNIIIDGINTLTDEKIQDIDNAKNNTLSDIADAKGDLEKFLNDEKEGIKAQISSVYKFKGSIQTKAELDLLENKAIGDVYDVADDGGMNYAWNGQIWDALGSKVDLREYATKSDLLTLKDSIKTEISNLPSQNSENIFKQQTYIFKPLAEIRKDGFIDDKQFQSRDLIPVRKPNSDGLYDINGVLITKEEYDRRTNIINFLKDNEFFIHEYVSGIDWDERTYREFWIKLPNNNEVIKYIPQNGDILYSEFGKFSSDYGNATAIIKENNRIIIHKYINGELLPFTHAKTMGEYSKGLIYNMVHNQDSEFTTILQGAPYKEIIVSGQQHNGFYLQELDYASQVKERFFPQERNGYLKQGTPFMTVLSLFGMPIIQSVSYSIKQKTSYSVVLLSINMLDGSICEIEFPYTIKEG